MSAGPKVSVVIPAFNAAPFLTAAIDSVLNQSHKSIEVVVVDDGSTDATEDIVSRYGRHVEYIRMRSNAGGPSRPRNVGIRAASGEYIALFDANGLMLPGKLSEQAEFLNAYPDIPFVFTDFTNVGSGDDSANFLAEHADFQAMPKIPLRKNWYRLTSSLAYETLITDTFIGTSTAMFRRRLVDDVGYFDESVKHGEDLEFFFRVARRFDLGFVNGVYSRRRLMNAIGGGRAPALEGKLRVYSKQRAVPKSPKAARDLDVCLAKILFSLGYLQRKRGERMKALGYYVRSWRRNPSNARIFMSALRAAFAR